MTVRQVLRLFFGFHLLPALTSRRSDLCFLEGLFRYSLPYKGRRRLPRSSVQELRGLLSGIEIRNLVYPCFFGRQTGASLDEATIERSCSETAVVLSTDRFCRGVIQPVLARCRLQSRRFICEVCTFSGRLFIGDSLLPFF